MIQLIVKYLLFSLLVSILFVSCLQNNEEQLYPKSNSSCDTINVSFSETINPIIETYCINCHKGSTAGGNIDLSGYPNVKVQADNGFLVGTIKHQTGYSPMPKGGNKLSDCKINQIEVWIKNGALNN